MPYLIFNSKIFDITESVDIGILTFDWYCAIRRESFLFVCFVCNAFQTMLLSRRIIRNIKVWRIYDKNENPCEYFVWKYFIILDHIGIETIATLKSWRVWGQQISHMLNHSLVAVRRARSTFISLCLRSSNTLGKFVCLVVP